MNIQDLGKPREINKWYVQYFNDTTLTWQEIRKECATKKEAETVAYSYGDSRKMRLVEYINGERNYIAYN